MSRWQLIRRSLRHYWRTNLAVLLGVVAATAVIGGALLVGDSVRNSLRQMSLDRLGGVDHALVAPRFFREELADSAGIPGVAPAVMLSVAAIHESEDSTRRAAGVNVYGCDERLAALLEVALQAPEAGEIIINRRLADQLQAATGDDISLIMEIPASIPRDSLLGDRNETVTELPLTIAAVAEDETTPGRFGLNPAQQLPLNAFVNLLTLQRQLGLEHIPVSRRNPNEKPARVNALFYGEMATEAEPLPHDAKGAEALTKRLAVAVTLEDLSLRLIPHEEQGYLALKSEQMILDEAAGTAAAEAADEMTLTTSPVLVYLLDEIASADDAEKFSMYSVVAGVDFDTPAPFGPFEFVAGSAPTKAGEVAINDWLAEDLGVTEPGQAINVRHKLVGDRGELPDVERTWTVTGIIRLAGPAADPHFTPYVEGITDADTFGDWRQPYPMNLDRVTDTDELYWDEHTTTPKLFLSLDVAQDLFASRYGKLTSMRVAPAEGQSLQQAADEFERRLLEKLNSGPTPATGLVFQPVKAQGLEAASGTTDFTGLFIGFSFFLIAAALLLIGLLVRLGLEQRVSEQGLLAAVGLTPVDVRRLYLGETTAIVLIGGLLGTLAAVAYAWLMIYGLKTWWFGAIGTKFLYLSITPQSLAGGFVIAVVMSILTCWWTLWRIRDVSTRQLLTGVSEVPLQAAAQQARGRRSRHVAIVCAIIAAVLTAGSLAGVVPASEAFSGFNWRTVSFFVVGVALLVGSLSLLAAWLDAAETRGAATSGVRSILGLGLRNAARHRGRSVFTASLIASATFVIVAVAAGRRNPTAEEPVNHSGNGGFVLLAEASMPILYDLNTVAGRANAGIDVTDPQDQALLEAMRVMPFRVRPGEDASCLNLYQTRLPRILGVSDEVRRAMTDENRFRFADTRSAQPWELLVEGLPGGRVPVLGDMNTLMYSLHKGIGETIDVPASATRQSANASILDAASIGDAEDDAAATLQVVGMLDGSVLQGMLLMSEGHFHELFPERAGFAYFLIEIDPAQADELSALLESQLADYGFDVTPVADRLADFLAVQNTYLSTFQTLGGLGLLLGTLGLGTVMLRNVLERRGELALLRAVGFRRGQVTSMVLVENAFLLLWGLAAGAISALLAMTPHLRSTGADVPWVGLLVMLLAVLGVGMLAALSAVREAVRTPILATLRAE
jgi:putative ABC transport system permease protein